MDERERKQQRYERFTEWVEIPMLALSLLLIPIVLIPLSEDLSPVSESVLTWAGIVIWLAFVVEYALLLVLSPDRRQTLRTRKLDLALVVVPVLRPLGLRRARVVRAGTALARIIVAAGRLMGRPGFGGTLGAIGGFILVGGVLVALAEHEQPGSRIAGVGDGIWWAFVTCTTVGYGDEFPVTVSGRVLAVVLMLIGIGALSAITANVAAYFVSNDVEDESDEIAERLARIEAHLERLGSGSGGRSGGAGSPDPA